MGMLDALVGVSEKLHARAGLLVTLRRQATGAYAPATLTATQTPTDEAVRAAPMSYGAHEVIGPRQAGDLRFTMYTATAPSVDDEIVHDSLVYNIVDVTRQYATDNVAYYEVWCRR